jgi:peptidoglycan/xylan/chitin deacetylase (PgdA/CDA1 family)
MPPLSPATRNVLLRPVVQVVGGTVATVVQLGLRLSRRQVGLALLYHGVAIRQGDKRREIVAPHGAAVFERQLRHIRRRYRLVSSAELLEAVRTRRRGQRFPVAVTFDDDLACHAQLSLPILERVGVPATFFLSGASLEEPFAFWWERLQRAFDEGIEDIPAVVGAEGSGILELGQAIESMTPAERDAVSSRLAERLGPDPPDAGMRAADVRRLVAPGMTVGFHTRRHDPLASLPEEALEAALHEGRKELEEIVGRPLDVIGYPHGSADRRVAAAARTAGFRVGFAVNEDAVWPGSDPLLLGRVTPTYRSPGHFAVQLVLQLLSRSR